MNTLAATLRVGPTMLRRDARLFWSIRGRLPAQLLTRLFALTLFYYVSRLVHVGRFPAADDYYAFVVIGMTVFQLLSLTLTLPSTGVREELVAGTFERLVVAPAGPVASLVATLFFPMAFALAMSGVMIAVAAAIFGLQVEWSTVALAVPVGLLAALAFMPFGIAVVAAVVVFKQATAGVGWVVAAAALVSGLYFPVELLPGWISWASEVQPFTPAVEVLRHVVVGTPLEDSLSLDLGRLAASALILTPLSVGVLALALRHARRRGTLLEY
jgi:ABC-2 type transport system permease protein